MNRNATCVQCGNTFNSTRSYGRNRRRRCFQCSPSSANDHFSESRVRQADDIYDFEPVKAERCKHSRDFITRLSEPGDFPMQGICRVCNDHVVLRRGRKHWATAPRREPVQFVTQANFGHLQAD